jgi:hypothetical protein
VKPPPVGRPQGTAQALLEVDERFLDAVALAGDLDFEVARYVPVTFLGDDCGEVSSGQLTHGAISLAERSPCRRTGSPLTQRAAGNAQNSLPSGIAFERPPGDGGHGSRIREGCPHVPLLAGLSTYEIGR